MTESHTPKDILICDLCRQHIDDLGWAMLYWDPIEHITELRLAHKKCNNREELRSGKEYRYSAELWWFAHSVASLQRLAELSFIYKWDVILLRRLIDIAWAIPLTADDKCREHALEWHNQRIGGYT